MTSQHLEVERKYEVDPGLPWVDLTGLPGVSSVAPPEAFSLRATYYDTDRLDLARVGITLRRRVGGSDAGWHLKVPADRATHGAGGRLEHGVPLGDDDEPVPASLADIVRPYVRGRQLRPVATLDTERTVYRLVGKDGTALAEAADDVVSARSGDDGEVTVSSWREWEIELLEGPVELLDAAGPVMLQAGAGPSASSSKLARALGDRLSALPRRPGFESLTPDSPARDVVQAHLIEQFDALLTRGEDARADVPDGVHKARVATRRLRSALATFRPLLDREITDPLRDELKWIAAELGGARDAEVLRMRLLDELADEPDDLVLGPIAARIEVELRSDHRKAHDELIEALDTDRYLTLLDRLDEVVTAPPFSEAADGPADAVLTQLVRKAYRRMARFVASGPPEDELHRDEWYHEIRKEAKRLRYAAESVAPAFGDHATAMAEAAEDVQEVLGEHQDSVVARQALRGLAVRMFAGGENTFTIGRLHALEQVRGDRAIEQFAGNWHTLSRKRMRRWLR
jgi:CHAD domain-containing protein